MEEMKTTQDPAQATDVNVPTNEEVGEVLSKLYGKKVDAFALAVAFKKDAETVDANLKTNGPTWMVCKLVNEQFDHVARTSPKGLFNAAIESLLSE